MVQSGWISENFIRIERCLVMAPWWVFVVHMMRTPDKDSPSSPTATVCHWPRYPVKNEKVPRNVITHQNVNAVVHFWRQFNDRIVRIGDSMEYVKVSATAGTRYTDAEWSIEAREGDDGYVCGIIGGIIGYLLFPPRTIGEMLRDKACSQKRYRMNTIISFRRPIYSIHCRTFAPLHFG